MKITEIMEAKRERINSIIKIMESDIALYAHKFVYKPIYLKNGFISKEMFEDRFMQIIESENLVDKSILKVKNFLDNNRMKNSYDDESLEFKIIEYLGQIFLSLSKDEIAYFDSNYYLSEIFMLCLRNGNLYDICTMIENGVYKGYNDYLMSGRGNKWR